MTYRFQWTLLTSCLPHTARLILSTTRGGVAFPMPSGFLKGWTIRSSTSLTSCLPLLFKHMPNLFFFSFFSFSLFVMTSNVENYNKRDLLLVSPLTFHISFGRSILTALMALLRSMSCPIILMSWAIPPIVVIFLKFPSFYFSH